MSLDWGSLIISSLVTIVGLFLTYKKAIKTNDNKIQELKVSHENEISKMEKSISLEEQKMKMEIVRDMFNLAFKNSKNKTRLEDYVMNLLLESMKNNG